MQSGFGARTLTALPAASSGGCNRSVGSFVWLTNSLLFYAAQRGVVVYDVDRRQSLATLLGHRGVVTCVDGVAVGGGGGGDTGDGGDGGDGGGNDTFWIVSGAADGEVVMWEVEVGEDGACRARAVSQVETAGPVTGVCCCRGSTASRDIPATRRGMLVAVASSDGGGSVRLLGLGAEGLCVLETVHIGTLVACVCLVSLVRDAGGESSSGAPSSTLSCSMGSHVLAGGFVDGSIRLWGLETDLTARDGVSIVRSAPCVLRHQHQNWVRAIDIAWDAGRQRMVMATASQDRYVRVWSLKEDEKGGSSGLDAYAPKPRLRLGARTVAVVCEGLLVGHEDWVHGARFHTSGRGSLTLLTSSMDRTMMLWRREGDCGAGEVDELGNASGDQGGSLWQSVSVVGDAGVNHLGFYTCAWRPDGLAIATHGHSGALHVWNAVLPDSRGRCLGEDGETDDGRGESDADLVHFLPSGPCCCGHTGPVVDSSWSPDGSTLCTVSADQTCRLWGNPDGRCWREVGRPQVHGHDFSCVTFVSNDVYVSGSEEKVLRVFENSLTDERGARVRVKLPALGLSNVVCQDGAGTEEMEKEGATSAEGDFNNAHASITEEDLSQNTLWPEIRKLYGHGNDLHRVTADPKGRFVASSSRAQEPLSAAIIVWDTETWTELARCAGHDLTVTCMDCMARDDGIDLLATVGRDRKLVVWERRKDASISNWRIRASKSKAHARVIWGCAWVKEEEDSPVSRRSTLITSARDGTISAWDVLDVPDGGENPGIHDDVLVKKAEIKMASSVMTVATRGPLIAAGLESGHVAILALREESRGECDPTRLVCELELLCTCGEEVRHAGAVRRVDFCPNGGAEGNRATLLSSVGDDGAVKFWRIP